MTVAGIDALGAYVTAVSGLHSSMTRADGLDLTQRYALAHEVLRNALALNEGEELRVAAAVPDTVVAKGMWEVARMRAQPMILR